jgi:hypothetical protein
LSILFLFFSLFALLQFFINSVKLMCFLYFYFIIIDDVVPLSSLSIYISSVNDLSYILIVVL